MPFYDFRCEEHGITELQRMMRESGDPAFCPVCGAQMRRVYDTSAAVRVFDRFLRNFDDPDPIPRPRAWQHRFGVKRTTNTQDPLYTRD